MSYYHDHSILVFFLSFFLRLLNVLVLKQVENKQRIEKYPVCTVVDPNPCILVESDLVSQTIRSGFSFLEVSCEHFLINTRDISQLNLSLNIYLSSSGENLRVNLFGVGSGLS